MMNFSTLAASIGRRLPHIWVPAGGGNIASSFIDSPEIGSQMMMTVSTGTAANANSSDNSVIWETTGGVPSSGTPDTITVDLTAVTSASRQSIIFAWFSQKTYNWNISSGTPSYGMPGDYTIQTNTAAGGGAAPTTGWVTAVTVTANTYTSRQHTLNTAGINWVRMVTTAVNYPGTGQGTKLKLRIYTNNPESAGLVDGIACCGDSITANNLTMLSIGGLNKTVTSIGDMMKVGGNIGYAEAAGTVLSTLAVNTTGYNPLQECHGQSGTTTTDWVTTGGNGNNLLAKVLAESRCKYVSIALGTNDAGGGMSGSTFSTNLLNMAQQCWAAGRIVIIPTIPWRGDSSETNVVTLNTAIAALIAANPKILAGPDLHAFYSSTNWQSTGQNNQAMITTSDGGIGGDNIHPNDLGSAYYRTLWAQWFAKNIYSNTLNGAVAPYSGTIQISGRNLVDGSGNVIFMRGVNYSGYESAAIKGYGNPDVSGGQAGQANGPKLTAMSNNWHLGVLRLPLNAASWFGGTYYDVNGNTVNADPSGSYQTQVIAQVNAATAAGFYVIIDLHWISVGKVAPLGQMAFPDTAGGTAFWTSVANTFKSNPAVIFELFNEPIIYDWTLLMQGGTASSYTGQDAGTGPIYYVPIYPYPVTLTSGTVTPGELFTATGGVSGRIIYYDTTTHIAYLCASTNAGTLAAISTGGTITGSTSGAVLTTTGASSVSYPGYQGLLNTVRSTGATNICLIGALNFSSDLSSWLAHVPTDPAPTGFSGTWTSQIAAVWHAYPDVSGTYSGAYGSGNYGQPNYGPNAYSAAAGILAGGYPVVITETGGQTGAGGATANNEPFVSNLTSWAGTNKVTTLYWTWDVWGDPQNVSITDVNGTPTVGEGQVQQTWSLGFNTRYGT